MHFTLEAKFRSVLISNSLLLGLSKLDYNLEQNKVEQQTPIPPKSRMKLWKSQNMPFSHPWFWVGAEGGINFTSILSKIADSRLSGSCLTGGVNQCISQHLGWLWVDITITILFECRSSICWESVIVSIKWHFTVSVVSVKNRLTNHPTSWAG